MTPVEEQIKGIVPRMNGWLSPDRAIQMYRLVQTLCPDLIVEIGVFAGRSLIPQAMALRDNGKGKIIGIDAWQTKAALEAETDQNNRDYWSKMDMRAIQQECIDSVWKYELDSKIVLVQAQSQNCHELIPPMDMLHIDGNHTELGSCRDVALYMPKLRENGYLFFNNSDWPQKQKALQMIDAECKLHSDNGNYRIYCKTHYTNRHHTHQTC